jgi:hypothetical protein
VNRVPDRWKTPPARPGGAHETAASLGEAAAADLDEFRTLFVERRALEATPEADSTRLDAVRREMARLAPAVQRHLETLGGALVTFEDTSPGPRTRRDPLPLTYVAAFGARDDYEPHADSLAGALETAAARYRSGEGGEERLARRRRRRHSSHRARLAKRVALWGVVGLLALTFYAVGLKQFGSWAPGTSAVPVAVGAAR